MRTDLRDALRDSIGCGTLTAGEPQAKVDEHGVAALLELSLAHASAQRKLLLSHLRLARLESVPRILLAHAGRRTALRDRSLGP